MLTLKEGKRCCGCQVMESAGAPTALWPPSRLSPSESANQEVRHIALGCFETDGDMENIAGCVEASVWMSLSPVVTFSRSPEILLSLKPSASPVTAPGNNLRKWSILGGYVGLWVWSSIERSRLQMEVWKKMVFKLISVGEIQCNYRNNNSDLES